MEPINLVMTGGWCRWHCFTHITITSTSDVTNAGPACWDVRQVLCYSALDLVAKSLSLCLVFYSHGEKVGGAMGQKLSNGKKSSG